MKKIDRNIKKTIKKRIELKQQKTRDMGIRDKMRMSGTPRPIPVELFTRDEIRRGYGVEKSKHYYSIDSHKQVFNEKNELQTGEIKYFSIVIPTMWKSNKIYRMLPIYEESEFVKEIIIIDNDTTKKTIHLGKYKKVRYYPQEKNIYVNPAWNLGHSLVNYNLILANDDIVINNFDDVIRIILCSNYDIVGFGVYNDTSSLRIETVYGFPYIGYGYFMYIKEYSEIPNKLKIWYGDKILFDRSKKRGIIRNADADYEKGKTINSDDKKLRNTVATNDVNIYEKLITSFNINVK